MARGYQCALLHAVQTGIMNRPSRAALKNASLSVFTTGEVSLRVIASLPFHDQGGAAVARGELESGALRERQIAILDLHRRMRLAAQLTHRFNDLGHAAAIGRMVVAQSTAVGVERKLPGA